METLNRHAKNILIGLIALYRYLLSPWIGHHCRFCPSCSIYAQEAIEIHGVFCGLKLSAMRLCKCHPWHPGGEDPVPPRLSSPVSHSTSDLR